MKGHGDVAMGAFNCMLAILAEQNRMIASPIEKKDGLFSLLLPFFNAIQAKASEKLVIPLALSNSLRISTIVTLGSGSSFCSLVQDAKRYICLLGIVIAFQARRCAAENDCASSQFAAHDSHIARLIAGQRSFCL